MQLQTARLTLALVDETARPEEFLPLFNSNPDLVEATELFTGKRAFDLSDVEMYLWQAMARDNSQCLAIKLSETGELVGTAVLLTPHPDEAFPWIGLLLISSELQGKGLGTEAVTAIEKHLVKQRWQEVRLNILQAIPRVRHFWERLGYTVLGERLDSNGRPCWILSKRLSLSILPHA